jgi:TPR repeat protein
MFELGGWYLVGSADSNSDFTLPQSDLEAFKWVKRAADRDLPRALFAMGYFCEMGIGQEAGTKEESDGWYKRAAENGDEKAVAKLKESQKMFKSKNSVKKKRGKGVKKAEKCVIM